MNNTQLSKSELRELKSTKEIFNSTKRHPIYVILDSLKCAHNIWTILRLSDAMLVEKVFICGDTITPPNWKIKTSSRGAERWVPWEFRENIVDVIQELRDQGVYIVSSEISKKSQCYDTVEYKFPIWIIFWREDEGVSGVALNASDVVVHLPIYWMCNSINVSTASSVLMYEIHRHIQWTDIQVTSKMH